MNLTAMTGMQEAYAVDTRLGYQEIHLGTFCPIRLLGSRHIHQIGLLRSETLVPQLALI